MPSDREVRERRHRVIRELLLGEEPVVQQQAMVDRLRARGFSATQSSVSRDLRDLGAVRVDGRYMIPSWVGEEESPIRRVIPLILEVRSAGPFQTLLKTEAGAAGFVARAIDEAEWEDIVGTLAGDNTVLILTENGFFQKLVLERLKHSMGEAEEIE